MSFGWYVNQNPLVFIRPFRPLLRFIAPQQHAPPGRIQKNPFLKKNNRSVIFQKETGFCPFFKKNTKTPF